MATAATTNGQHAFAPVLNALATMSSNADRAQKGQAHQYLEQFQKSEQAWSSTFAILQASQATDEAKLFAATTLKGKIVFDFHQLPKDTIPALRDTLLSILSTYSNGPKPIRTQLCVCLANLAIQFLEWKNVLQTVVNTLGSQSLACVFEFLHVLPEEVTEGRKINLTEDELAERTRELLEENGQQVLQLLTQYAQSGPEAAKNPQLMDCITSWIREVPLSDIINSPLIDVVFNALQSDASFDAAVETVCTMFKETREVDENVENIKALYPRLAALQPRIHDCAGEEDWETFKGVTRVFAEAGEAWVVLIAREAQQFRALVECVLACCSADKEREALSQTFNFWYELKQYITLDRYMEARLQFVDIYSSLVDIMIGHMQYPRPESGDDNATDLFDGDREAEDKFREFRHQIGDVLKDCCEVIGVTECLRKSFDLVEAWVSRYGAQAQAGKIPHWQQLEAPLFSMRAMGRMVPREENIMLPRLIPLIVQIPDHEKVRFQAVMALGRYTEWTSEHPDTLQDQLNFIITAFQHPSQEVVKAAALSFKFFCNDCAELLKGHMQQLQQFYVQVIDRLPPASQEEITEGVASVIAKQPLDHLYDAFKACCDPIISRLMEMAESASEKEQKLAIADRLNLVTVFIQWVTPYVEPKTPHPIVEYCQEIFDILSVICQRFIDFVPIVERVCRCWRYMVLSYRTHIAPLLPTLAEKLAAGFSQSRQGCFLWATDSIVREFSDVNEVTDASTTQAIYTFYEQQATTFLRALNDVPPEELPDVIEDFFRLTGDVLLYHPTRVIPSQLMPPILSAASTSLTLLKEEPLMATLHFLRDFLAYGTPDAPSSTFDADGQYRPKPNPPEIQAAVKSLVHAQGEQVTQRCLTGMMYTFPADCFPDASGVLLALFQLLPAEVAGWTAATVQMLPQGSIAPQEQERLIRNIQQRIDGGEIRKVRTLLQDFTNSYRRRNVAPREGLGRLEATRFRFSG
ncbi:ARM repeat-containing protein [Teratosphaeria nubilosa]|uniref:ARM repeat-containing protein n=1 Tax=Teratosphaeria nubilosa TaxID=161662 RepID=A0A6G1LP64_9PEZI|nr:ARM repeat-containing protein [Teratosphaeria nubilosa]